MAILKNGNCQMAIAGPLTRSRSSVATTAFVRLAERLKINRVQQAILLGVKPRTLDRLRAGETTFGQNELERLSHLISIWEGATAFFGSTDAGVEWLTNANADFGNSRPLDVMLKGNVADLLAVRRYLDIARQGW
jgi:putative toxin-antitoxin system antitoxin component (TIGR02293 family)